jgi:hypothetical protein
MRKHKLHSQNEAKMTNVFERHVQFSSGRRPAFNLHERDALFTINDWYKKYNFGRTKPKSSIYSINLRRPGRDRRADAADAEQPTIHIASGEGHLSDRVPA